MRIMNTWKTPAAANLGKQEGHMLRSEWHCLDHPVIFECTLVKINID